MKFSSSLNDVIEVQSQAQSKKSFMQQEKAGAPP